MTSPYKTVGDRVARATEKNFPSHGKYEWVESKSKMHIQEQDLVFGEVVPGEMNPMTVKRSEFINNTSVQNSQAFVVSTNGMMDAIVGQNFTVTADEYELDGTPVAKGRVIARGHWDDSGLQVHDFQTQPEPEPA